METNRGMTQRTLTRLKNLWQKRLGLEDWKISATFCSEETFKEKIGGDSVGGCFWTADRKIAEIYIRKPSVLHSLGDDLEDILVHEMLHILLEGHKEEIPPDDVNTERAINQLSAALIRPYRRRKKA